MQRPDPMIPCKPGACDVECERNKAAWMEALYFLDGRDLLSHPQRGLFTGLAAKYANIQSTDSY